MERLHHSAVYLSEDLSSIPFTSLTKRLKNSQSSSLLDFSFKGTVRKSNR